MILESTGTWHIICAKTAGAELKLGLGIAFSDELCRRPRIDRGVQGVADEGSFSESGRDL